MPQTHAENSRWLIKVASAHGPRGSCVLRRWHIVYFLEENHLTEVVTPPWWPSHKHSCTVHTCTLPKRSSRKLPACLPMSITASLHDPKLMKHILSLSFWLDRAFHVDTVWSGWGADRRRLILGSVFDTGAFCKCFLAGKHEHALLKPLIKHFGLLLIFHFCNCCSEGIQTKIQTQHNQEEALYSSSN